MSTKVLFVLGFLSLSSAAGAQNCPGGIPSGAPGCIPPDNPASPLYRGGQSAQPAAPRMIWADRWGAIAIDDKTGNAGTVSGALSKRKAVRTAIDRCSNAGSKNCKISLAYYNQCAAVAWGTGYRSVVGSATKEEAEKLAVNKCSAGARDCKVVYSDCSMAERIQ